MKKYYKILFIIFIAIVAIIAFGLTGINATGLNCAYSVFNPLKAHSENTAPEYTQENGQQTATKNVNASEISEINAKCNQKIKVTGNGTISVTPEIVKINFGIETLADTIAKANEQHQENAKSLLIALKDYDVISTYYNTYPIYNYENEKHLTGYEIYSNYELSTDNLNDLNDIINLILSNGGTSISNIEYSIKDNSSSYYSALSLALSDAQAKASSLIDSDMTLKIKCIKEQNYCFNPYRISFSPFNDTIPQAKSVDILENETNDLNNAYNNIDKETANANKSSFQYKNIEINANIEVEFIVCPL